MTGPPPENGPLLDRQTADCSAAQQVIPSLLFRTASARGQKSVRFCFCIGVQFAPEHFANAIGVCSKFLNDIRVSYALKAHHMSGNRVDERQSGSLFCDNVQSDTRNRVSFMRGVIPEQVSHGSILSMAGETIGKSEELPVVSYGCTFDEGAVSSIGAGKVIPCPDSLSKLHLNRSIKADICGRIDKFSTFIVCCALVLFRKQLKLLAKVGFLNFACNLSEVLDRPTNCQICEAYLAIVNGFEYPKFSMNTIGGGAGCALSSSVQLEGGRANLLPSILPVDYGRAAASVRPFFCGVTHAA